MKKNNYSVYGEHFNGAKISKYGLENNFVDYATLAKNIDCVLCNGIFGAVPLDEWEQIGGFNDNTDIIEELQDIIEELEEDPEEDPKELKRHLEELRKRIEELEEDPDDDNLIEKLQDRIEELEEEQDYSPEVFQWFITDNFGAEILSLNNEIIYYNERLDIYLWGVTHFGTSWDYVLTDIPCDKRA